MLLPKVKSNLWLFLYKSIYRFLVKNKASAKIGLIFKIKEDSSIKTLLRSRFGLRIKVLYITELISKIGLIKPLRVAKSWKGLQQYKAIIKVELKCLSFK